MPVSFLFEMLETQNMKNMLIMNIMIIFLHNRFYSAPHIVAMNMLPGTGMAGHITSQF